MECHARGHQGKNQLKKRLIVTVCAPSKLFLSENRLNGSKSSFSGCVCVCVFHAKLFLNSLKNSCRLTNNCFRCSAVLSSVKPKRIRCFARFWFGISNFFASFSNFLNSPSFSRRIICFIHYPFIKTSFPSSSIKRIRSPTVN